MPLVWPLVRTSIMCYDEMSLKYQSKTYPSKDIAAVQQTFAVKANWSSCNFNIIQELSKLKVESVGFVPALLKCTSKIVDRWVSYPGCQMAIFWVGKASWDAKKCENKKIQAKDCRYKTLTRLVSPFQSPSLSVSVFLSLLHNLSRYICCDRLKPVSWCWEDCVKSCKTNSNWYSPQMHSHSTNMPVLKMWGEESSKMCAEM